MPAALRQNPPGTRAATFGCARRRASAGCSIGSESCREGEDCPSRESGETDRHSKNNPSYVCNHTEDCFCNVYNSDMLAEIVIKKPVAPGLLPGDCCLSSDGGILRNQRDAVYSIRQFPADAEQQTVICLLPICCTVFLQRRLRFDARLHADQIL